MPSPFYNCIKGTTSGTPGTGAFTPNAAATGFRAWTNVPTGWVGMVRYEDGSSWELQYSYWNGTTLSRASTQFVDSSSGSALTLTSSATAALIIDANEVMSHVGTTGWRGWIAQAQTNNTTAIGFPTLSTGGTTALTTVANTNMLTEQNRQQITSPTTANGQSAYYTITPCAVVSTTSGRGGWEFTARWGCTQIPTGPKLMIGMLNATFVAQTGEPSARVASLACFAKDSTDTNIQLLVNNNSGSGTKTDTGIALVANGFYETNVWMEPGTNKVYALLIRLDTGAIWYGTTTTDVPLDGSLMFPQMCFNLSATTGTAFITHFCSMFVRNGA